MKTKIEIAVLTFIVKWGLRSVAPFARALGRRLPGPLPTFVPPEVDTSDIPEVGEEWFKNATLRIGEYGCTAWRKNEA